MRCYLSRQLCAICLDFFYEVLFVKTIFMRRYLLRQLCAGIVALSYFMAMPQALKTSI